jgi:prohibitin 2
MSPQGLIRLIGAGIAVFVLILALSQSTYVVDPGHRGVRVTLGKVSDIYEQEGFGFKLPFISRVEPMLVRQQKQQLEAVCYSSDLQQVRIKLSVLYRVPQESVVRIYRDYYGDPFQSLIAPRVQEALKEVTATRSAEHIVQQREEIKTGALEAARQKITELLRLEDLVMEDIALSPELEAAIELKMVQEQEANRARFTQQKTEVEAQTAIIQAKGEAESIQIRGDALSRNPRFIELEVVGKWNGRTPAVIGGQVRSAQMLLPLRETQQAPLESSTNLNSGGPAANAN